MAAAATEAPPGPVATLQSFAQYLLLDHFAAYSEWPWSHFNDPVRQLQEHPAFLVGEVLFILLTAATCVHAFLPSPRGKVSLNGWLFVLTLLAGVANDYIFMILPVVDNFWQAQAVIMLTPRMPLYIPCVYICFMYWPLVCARRAMDCLCPAGGPSAALHRNIAQAAVTGLFSCAFYAPYDVVGARFLWWTWHHDDEPIRDRWLGAPDGSTMFTLCLPAALSFLFQLGVDRSWSALRTSLVVCSFSTLLMIVIMNIPILVATPTRPGVPTGRSLVFMIFVFIGTALFCALRARRDGRTRASTAPKPVHGFFVLLLVVYFWVLFAVMAACDPAAQISTGTHQVFGPCNVTDVDLMQHVRKRYNCAQDFPQWYFRLWERSDSEAEGETSSRWTFVDPTRAARASKSGIVSWYTVQGQPHESYNLWVAAEFAMALLGSLTFAWAARVSGGAEEVGDRKQA